ncbi:zinc finger CCHC domain-containing protein 9-like [Drosophila albomicans]|uniref:Zinc finger CCHC domain-containing protein 9-like n=1 Tax=Drosophila albomicans TaxID=7291 RepID=A0A9C6T3K2_DROAB|nr:zinc finger CCHC domain-containing protein 9-like [Drosophila albomicans]
MYFEEKIVLAQSIKLDNDELLEQIIEGITSQNLRNQARIQRFGDTEQMLQAFAHIRLPKYGAMGGTKTTAESNNKRCHNCNSKCHFAKECRKPKREPGSCYACGEMGHVIAECKKKSVGVLNKSTGFDNSYNAS